MRRASIFTVTMEVLVLNTLSVVVVAIIVLMGSTHAGNIYPRTKIEFEVPKLVHKFGEGFGQRTVQENTAQPTHENVVSYSVPYEDFYYLHQQQNVNQQISNHAPTTQIGNYQISAPTVSISSDKKLTAPKSILNVAKYSPPIRVPINYQSNLAVNSLQNINIPAINIPAVKLTAPINQQSQLPVNFDQHINVPVVNLKSGTTDAPINQHSNLVFNISPYSIPSENTQSLNLPASINEVSNSEFNKVQNINVPAVSIPSVDLPISLNPQSSLDFTTEHHTVHHEVVSDGLINEENSAPPKIIKDIYFHVPPPEIDEPVLQAVTPKKKIYKIIFIKVPSQETKNIAQLYGNEYNQVAPIEDKTIIYVLSKKPEPQPVFLPKSKPSEHEVLFVKYRGGPNE